MSIAQANGAEGAPDARSSGRTAQDRATLQIPRREELTRQHHHRQSAISKQPTALTSRLTFLVSGSDVSTKMSMNTRKKPYSRNVRPVPADKKQASVPTERAFNDQSVPGHRAKVVGLAAQTSKPRGPTSGPGVSELPRNKEKGQGRTSLPILASSSGVKYAMRKLPTQLAVVVRLIACGREQIKAKLETRAHDNEQARKRNGREANLGAQSGRVDLRRNDPAHGAPARHTTNQRSGHALKRVRLRLKRSHQL